MWPGSWRQSSGTSPSETLGPGAGEPQVTAVRLDVGPRVAFVTYARRHEVCPKGSHTGHPERFIRWSSRYPPYA